MIAITAAAGKTGRHVLRALCSAGFAARALVHSSAGAETVRADGAGEAVVSDLTYPDELPGALEGCEAVVHIGPPMHPREIAMGQNVVDAARRAGVGHVVLMSVTHPQLEPLLNHQSKLAVERHLLGSRLPFTILQPMHYMQNVAVRDCVDSGRFRQPYSLDQPLSFVDLADVGAVVAAILSAPAEHRWATYELCGSDTLTGHEIAQILSEVSGTLVRAGEVPVDAVLPEGAPDYTIDGFTRLVNHYDRYGILGNPNVLRWLLGREPATFADYVRRELG
ncbi:SDR family oxidoreductase [Amycolatopsis echigonensis]|uniref:NmrA family NAD(P)-binding protein n=1 Tax=Amycolatopsis echigonensis TaxID=2576905 RepID=A0A8E1W1Q5_9PSEU|nr:NmrA family NAD(P)-binding protein [Amycolatopsis echigonensis]MBB2502346.1 NmrA family NAD(P)-binding protein [Amycolatopsis echigonensis]